MPKSTTTVSWIRFIYLLVAAVFIYVVISQVSSLKDSLSQLKTSNMSDNLVVLLMIASTYLFSAFTYCLLALKKLRYKTTLIVETGANTLNRLLPAGIGAMGANFLYLTKFRHSRLQAATVVAINNGIGVIGNIMLLVVLLLVVKTSPLQLHAINGRLIIICLGIFIAGLGVLYLMPSTRRKLRKNVARLIEQLAVYKSRKARLFGAFLSSLCLTLACVVALKFSLNAVGADLSISSLMLSFSFAMGLGAIIPAPGGIGSVDAGLVGALVAYHIPLSQALASVLIYRLISFWIPLVLGIGPLIYCRRRGYI